jgi:DNA-binding NarL/FixJ family response regulator
MEPTAAVSAIVGRESELHSVERFLAALPAGPSTLLVEGTAGIGKTTLWLEAVRAAARRGYRVLQATPAEAEAKLSYATLADLIGGVFDETRSALPAPQERALGTALLRLETSEAVDPRTTATALVGVLTALAAEMPVLVAVDDVQWCDRASARALEFAARRLPPPVGLLLTLRTEDSDATPLGLGRALPVNRLQRLVPGPLSLGALHHLIASRFETAPSRPTLARITAASGGNPFFALEIARALTHDSSQYRLGDPLPVPRSLQELALAHVRALPAAARKAVLVAAALSRPTVATVVETLARECDAQPALVAAEEAGVLVSERERIRFTHPLLASAVYGAASDSQRRQLHRRLAEVVVDPEERARHRAAGSTETDEATASELEQAARTAARRGAHDSAVELFEASCRLTPPDQVEELVRRVLGQAFAVHGTGDQASAHSLAQRAVADSPTPLLRVQGLRLLSVIEWDAGSVESVFEHMEEALVAAADDRDLQRDVYVECVGWTRTLDPRRALEFAEPAERLLGDDSDPWWPSFLFDRFWAEALLGRKPRRELLGRGLELEPNTGPQWPIPILWFTCTDDFDAARARHGVEDAWFRDRGDERMRGDRLAYRAVVELRAGRWNLAEQYAERSCAMIEGIDAGRAHAVAFGWRSFVDAHRGRLERARSTLLGLLEEAQHTNARTWWVERLLSILGFVEFMAGDYEASDRALTQMREHYDSLGVTEPLLDWSEPFHIESLVALGEVERARQTLMRLEERGRTFPRLWIDVTLPRARALVLAAEDDVSGALAALDALDVRVASELPFELAWALLVKGRLLRRLKRRRSAATTLQEALEIFERLGAPVWAEWTRSELVRVGPRRRAPDELTATELRVAELAATGLTNREVANAAFISTKTVEANLARVYRKLGIRSRAELGARMGDRVRPAETKT